MEGPGWYIDGYAGLVPCVIGQCRLYAGGGHARDGHAGGRHAGGRHAGGKHAGGENAEYIGGGHANPWSLLFSCHRCRSNFFSSFLKRRRTHIPSLMR